jgi:trk system potassium uptake protein TrkA
VPKDWFGKSLSQIDIRKKIKINILTIKRGAEVFIPAPDTVIKTDDIAFVIGEVRDIQKCFRI